MPRKTTVFQKPFWRPLAPGASMRKDLEMDSRLAQRPVSMFLCMRLGRMEGRQMHNRHLPNSPPLWYSALQSGSLEGRSTTHRLKWDKNTKRALFHPHLRVSPYPPARP
jgi:hypothetical protein